MYLGRHAAAAVSIYANALGISWLNVKCLQIGAQFLVNSESGPKVNSYYDCFLDCKRVCELLKYLRPKSNRLIMCERAVIIPSASNFPKRRPSKQCFKCIYGFEQKPAVTGANTCPAFGSQRAPERCPHRISGWKAPGEILTFPERTCRAPVSGRSRKKPGLPRTLRILNFRSTKCTVVLLVTPWQPTTLQINSVKKGFWSQN